MVASSQMSLFDFMVFSQVLFTTTAPRRLSYYPPLLSVSPSQTTLSLPQHTTTTTTPTHHRARFHHYIAYLHSQHSAQGIQIFPHIKISCIEMCSFYQKPLCIEAALTDTKKNQNTTHILSKFKTFCFL